MKSIVLVFVVTVIFLVGMTKFNNTTNYNEALKYMELSQYYNGIQGGGGNNNVFMDNIEVEVSFSGAVNSEETILVSYGTFLSQAIQMIGGIKNNADTRCFNGNYIILENSTFYIPIGMGIDKININTAKKEELMMLNTIGAITAVKIIEYREQYGKFETLESIMKVNGIGTHTYYNIRDNIIL